MAPNHFVCLSSLTPEDFKVPEGHHPRGTTLREALRGNFPLRGLCGGLSEGSAGSLRGFCRVSAGFCGGPRDFPRVFGGSDPMLVTLRNCWRRNSQEPKDVSRGRGCELLDVGSPKNTPTPLALQNALWAIRERGRRWFLRGRCV